jgi:hypothetical protein
MKLQFAILIFILLICEASLAQSGRNKKPAPTPSPSADQTPTSSPSASPSPQPAQPEASPTPDPERPKFHPKALIVTGRAIFQSKSWWRSDDVKAVADNIKSMWDLERVPVKIVKGGKLTRIQAVARAKQETDNYVLYMEIHVVDAGLTRERVDHIDYVLLMPQTGEAVRQFTLDARNLVQRNETGTPLPPRTQGTPAGYWTQLEFCAWEMARVLRNWL